MKLYQKRIKKLLFCEFSSTLEKKLSEISYLLLRVSFSALMMTHGYAKLKQYTDKVESFPDPIGLGSKLSLILTITTEFFVALLLLVGLFTRWCALSLVITMSIIIFVFHAGDPLNQKELAILYWLAFIVLMISGGRKWSLDHWLRSRFKS